MLRSRAFIAVRQEQRESAEPLPLRLAGADELVNDDLGAVGEVAVLTFPDHQRIRLGGGVAVLEAHDGLFGKHGVDDLHPRLMIRDVLQREVRGVAVLLVQNSVAMEERAASAVLSGDTNRKAVLDQRRVSQRLGATPIQGHLASDHLLTVRDDLRNTGDVG